MEGQRGPESIKPVEEKTDSGFSEKRAARILEGKKQDASQAKKRKPLLRVLKQKIIQQIVRRDLQATTPTSQRDQILAVFATIESQLALVVQTLGQLDSRTRRYEQLFQEAIEKQKILGELLSIMAQEQKGELTEDSLSKQLANLVK